MSVTTDQSFSHARRKMQHLEIYKLQYMPDRYNERIMFLKNTRSGRITHRFCWYSFHYEFRIAPLGKERSLQTVGLCQIYEERNIDKSFNAWTTGSDQKLIYSIHEHHPAKSSYRGMLNICVTEYNNHFNELHSHYFGVLEWLHLVIMLELQCLCVLGVFMYVFLF